MYDLEVRAKSELRDLRDCIERILLANGPVFEPEQKLQLRVCNGLLHLLSTTIIASRSIRLQPASAVRWVELCRLELIVVERAIDQVDGWNKRRLIPSEFGEDEIILRALYDQIDRYLEGLEPEYVALPVHQLRRAVRDVRLMQVWDVIDAEYQPKLRLALRHLESAIAGAECAPRN